MSIRKLPDGSILDTDTGALMPGNPAQEAAARAISEKAGIRAPVRSKGQQIMQVEEIGRRTLIEPVQRLAISPYSAMGAEPMSDGTKRILMVGGLVAAAYGIVWLNGKMKSKGKK